MEPAEEFCFGVFHTILVLLYFFKRFYLIFLVYIQTIFLRHLFSSYLFVGYIWWRGG